MGSRVSIGDRFTATRSYPVGYTHYWSFNMKRSFTAGKAQDLEAKYQQAIMECQRFIYKTAEENRKLFGSSMLAGFPAHTKPGTYGGLKLNGKSGDDCEDFALREHFKQNDESNFCKTGRYYYDEVVQVCLLILKYRLGDAMTLTSDGDSSEWMGAQIVASKFLRRKVKIPSTIRDRDFEQQLRKRVGA
jgi:hypothetical protein